MSLIIGIDPGSRLTGYGIIEKDGGLTRVARSVSGGIRTMLITPTSGTFTTAQAEALSGRIRYITEKLFPVPVSQFQRNNENFLKDDTCYFFK